MQSLASIRELLKRHLEAGVVLVCEFGIYIASFKVQCFFGFVEFFMEVFFQSSVNTKNIVFRTCLCY